MSISKLLFENGCFFLFVCPGILLPLFTPLASLPQPFSRLISESEMGMLAIIFKI